MAPRDRLPLRRLLRPLATVLCHFCLAASFGSHCLAGEQGVVRFAVIGDGGTGDRHQDAIARQMAAWHERLPYSLTLMLGDNIYGGLLGLCGGDRDDFEEKFDRPYAALLARGVVFRAALGNHDMCHREGRDLIEDYDRFHIDGAHGYYAFTAGEANVGGGPQPLIEFLVLNTGRLKDGDPAQARWLEQALGATQARWRIVYGHHPLYSTMTGWLHGGNSDLRRKLEPLLTAPRVEESGTGSGRAAEPRVHGLLAGHDHIYERFHPIRGVVHFVCGASGKLARGRARGGPDTAVFKDDRRVFMLWEATSDMLTFRAIDENGQAFDCGIIRLRGQAEAVPCDVLARQTTRD